MRSALQRHQASEVSQIEVLNEVSQAFIAFIVDAVRTAEAPGVNQVQITQTMWEPGVFNARIGCESIRNQRDRREKIYT
jgi:hypothetical protein